MEELMELLDEALLEGEEKMDKAILAYERELTTVRTGRANASILDTISIDYYGVATPVKQISSISMPEANQLYIKPYDRSSLKLIETAIFASTLGITPQNDGTGIRLIFPKMTEEIRRERVKQVNKMEESAKVAIRNIRRDVISDIKAIKLPEDTEKNALADVENLVKEKIEKIGVITEAKNKDLMSI